MLTLACCALVFLLLGALPALKTSPLYFVFLGVAELIHWSQMRQNIKCDVCDFDPILYKEDWKKARARVEAKMQKAYTKATDQMKEALEFSASPMSIGGKMSVEQKAPTESFKAISPKGVTPAADTKKAPTPTKN